MTIPTSQASEIFLGNGATNTFNFTFVGDNETFISVVYTDTLGVAVVLSPSQYNISLNAPPVGSIWGVGGTITYPTMGSPIADGTSLTVSRTLPLTQTTTIANQGNFFPQAIEVALDTLEMQIQQVSGRSGQFRGTWITDTAYNFGDYVVDGANGANTGNYYMAIVGNTSGVWATDLAAGYWVLVIDIQTINADVAAAAASAAAAMASQIAASGSAAAASGSAAAALVSEQNAATSASQAADYAASYSGTSTTSVAIGLGAKVFTTQTNKLWVNGQFIQIASNANATNFMHGTVTSYAGSTLTMNITDIGGSGTFTDWNISISGSQGPTGPTGGVQGPGSSVVNQLALFGNLLGDQLVGATGTGYTKVVSGVLQTPSATVPLADLAPQVANTFVANATAGSAAPTATIALAASQLAGRGSTGNLAPIALAAGLTIASTTLGVDFASDATAIAKISTITALTPANLAAIGSSTTFAGLIQLATAAVTLTGTSTTTAITPAGFAGNNSLGVNGYYKFPGGFTIQWGQFGTITNGGTLVVTYPIPFITVHIVTLTSVEGAGTNDNCHLLALPTNPNFTVAAGGSGTSGGCWIATGLT